MRSFRWFALGCLCLTACTDDPVQANNPAQTACAAGEVRNPISGECQSNRVVPAPTPTRDMGTPTPADMPTPPPTDMGPRQDLEPMPLPDMPPVMVDVGMDMRCAPGLDPDMDGLDNACECQLGSDPGNSDTDGDGLPDGTEDRNQNCRVEPANGETQPTQADTDGDGLDDGQEQTLGLDPLAFDTDGDGISDGVEENSCLNPKSKDTDGDGIEDASEDTNLDGMLGTCAGRMYQTTCAAGEYDPCSPDTDGDGTPDGEEVNFLECRPEFLNQLPAPNLISNPSGDYQLSLAQGVTSATVSGLGAGSNADAFNHPGAAYAGFIASVNRPAGDADALRDHVVDRVRTVYPGVTIAASGRRTTSHDGFTATSILRLDLGTSGNPGVARDRALSAIAGGSASHAAPGALGATTGSMTLVLGIVDRGNSKYIVTGGATDLTTYNANNLPTGYLLDDLGSSMSVARASDMLVPECVAYTASDKPKVDFLWIIDGSGSMSDENELVRTYADDFVTILNQRNIDYRLGVVSSHCSGISADPSALPPTIAPLFAGSGFLSPCPSLPFGNVTTKNGVLCDTNGANFTDDPQKFKGCVSQVARQSISTEFTVTMGAAAIHRALPRAAGDPKKLRDDAATVIISVTDEFDDYIQTEMNWTDGAGMGATPVDPTLMNFNSAQLDQVVQPFVDYFLKPEVAATVFGIFWLPGQVCSTAAEAAAGIERIVNKTGGTAGNICNGTLQATLARIAEASAGLASNLRLRGTPIPPSVVVRVGQVLTQQIVTPTRSRGDGWDYDAVTNAVAFNGNARPQSSDRVIITYRRWANSIQQCVADEDCPGNQKSRCIQGECR